MILCSLRGSWCSPPHGTQAHFRLLTSIAIVLRTTSYLWQWTISSLSSPSVRRSRSSFVIKEAWGWIGSFNASSPLLNLGFWIWQTAAKAWSYHISIKFMGIVGSIAQSSSSISWNVARLEQLGSIKTRLTRRPTLSPFSKYALEIQLSSPWAYFHFRALSQALNGMTLLSKILQSFLYTTTIGMSRRLRGVSLECLQVLHHSETPQSRSFVTWTGSVKLRTL